MDVCVRMRVHGRVCVHDRVCVRACVHLIVLPHCLPGVQSSPLVWGCNWGGALVPPPSLICNPADNLLSNGAHLLFCRDGSGLEHSTRQPPSGGDHYRRGGWGDGAVSQGHQDRPVEL